MPRTESTVAPNINSWATLALGALSGTKIIVFKPMEAHMPDREEAALPVEAAVIKVIPISLAEAAQTALARSFREPVGF